MNYQIYKHIKSFETITHYLEIKRKNSQLHTINRYISGGVIHYSQSLCGFCWTLCKFFLEQHQYHTEGLSKAHGLWDCSLCGLLASVPSQDCLLSVYSYRSPFYIRDYTDKCSCYKPNVISPLLSNVLTISTDFGAHLSSWIWMFSLSNQSNLLFQTVIISHNAVTKIPHYFIYHFYFLNNTYLSSST